MSGEEEKEGEGRHVCPQCGKSYDRPARVREHIERVHEGVRHQCPTCLKCYRTKQSRDRHQRQCSGVTYYCRDCGLTFNSVAQLGKHRSNVHDNRPTTGSSKKRKPPTSTATSSEGAARDSHTPLK